MFLVRLSLRSLLHHWPLSLASLFTLALGIASLTSVPVFLDIITYLDLHTTLSSYAFPGSRNISVVAAEGSRLNETLYDLISGKLDDLIAERISVAEMLLSDLPPESTPGPEKEAQKFQFYHLWAFPDLEKRVRLVEGRFPHYQGACQLPDAQSLPILETAVGVDAASKKGIHVGEFFTAEGAREQYLLAVVGIVDPIDPQHDAWWEDRSTFSYHLKLVGRSIELATLSMHVPQETMEGCFPRFNLSWRILLNSSRITPQNAKSLRETLTNLQAQSSKDHAELQSGLPSILSEFQNRSDTARVIGLLVASQVFLFTILSLGILVSVRVERYRNEFSRLLNRGASNLQVILVFTLQNFLLGLLAIAVVWLVMLCGLEIWRDFDVTAGSLQVKNLAQFSRFVLLAGGMCWLLITVQSAWTYLSITRYGNTSRNLEGKSHPLGLTPQERPIWQRFYLDGFLSLFSGILCWQLTQSGSLITRRVEGARLVDPLLLFSSTLMVVAVNMIVLRVMPALCKALTWLVKPGRGKYVYLALSRFSSQLRTTGQSVLFVSLAVSFTLVANAFRASLFDAQREVAHDVSGADIRLTTEAGTPEAMLESVSSLTGILAVSPVIRPYFSKIENQNIDLLAIDPNSLSDVNEILPRVLLERLGKETSDGSIPGIFSTKLVSSPGSVGLKKKVIISGQEFLIEIVGIAQHFPTVGEKFVLVDINRLARRIDPDPSRIGGEIWLSVDGYDLDTIIREGGLKDRVLSDVHTELAILQSNVLSQVIAGAFGLAALAANLLCVAAFLVLYGFSSDRQNEELPLACASGFDPASFSPMNLMMGFFTVIFGTAVGIGIGYGIARLLHPSIWKILANSLEGVKIRMVVFDWTGFLVYCAIMMGSYILILFTLSLAGKRGVIKRMRLPVEE